MRRRGKACGGCGKAVGKADKGLRCRICCGWFHGECQGVPLEVVLNLVEYQHGEGVWWCCKGCRQDLRDSSARIQELERTNQELEEYIESLESSDRGRTIEGGEATDDAPPPDGEAEGWGRGGREGVGTGEEEEVEVEERSRLLLATTETDTRAAGRGGEAGGGRYEYGATAGAEGGGGVDGGGKLEGVEEEVTRPVDLNIMKRNMTIAKGFLDISLLSANANQLKNVINFGDNEGNLYYVILTGIIVSLVLQVASGVVLIVAERFDINKEEEQERGDTLNTVVTLLIFLILIINVFIAGLGVEVGSPVTHLPRGHPNLHHHDAHHHHDNLDHTDIH